MSFNFHVYLYAASYKDSSKNTGYMAVDYVLVRKFVGNEPTAKIISAQNEGNSSESVSENNSGNSLGNSSDGTSEQSISENNSENVSEDNFEYSFKNSSENISELQTAAGSNPNSETSGIRLSSPYEFNFSTLVNELNTSGTDTIFLSVDSEDVWQYERFVKMAHVL